MSARVWTLKELNRVHPFSDQRKAEGWQWMNLVEEGQGWAAVIPPVRSSRPPHDFDFELGILAAVVWVDSAGRIRYEGAHPPVDVALAVILASKGLDSREAMAAALDVEAQNHREWAGSTTPTGRANTSDCMSESAAVADAYSHAAVMLRRGTVQP